MEFQLPSARSSIRVWSFICIIIIALVPFFVTGAYGFTNETDRLSLLEIKAKIVDPFGALNSWNTSVHFCRWFGVTCGRRHQRVTVLALGSQALSGPISPYIGNLTFLRLLFLENNSFHSSLPPEIGHLSRLGVLFLTNNTLSGKIPSNLSLCSNLVNLDLGANLLEGNLPASLGSLLKLEVLILQFNHLTGQIPPSYGNLSFLTTFTVLDNRFHGKIPNELGKLRKLERLSFASNDFSGTFPSPVFNISSIKLLDLSGNIQLEGSLPPNIGLTLPNLEILRMSKNGFSGIVPQSISNASNLKDFIAAENKMSGGIPSFQKMSELEFFGIWQNQFGTGQEGDLDFLCSLVNSTSLEVLEIGENNFGGSIPGCIGNLSPTLTYLSFIENPLSGSIPSGVGNFINLRTLVIQYSKVSGTIPSEIGNLTSLMELYLNSNYLSGYIPKSIGNLTQLTKLLLNDNNLEGSIPSTLSMCQNLLVLILGRNKLTGVIPSEIMSLSSLSILADFSENQLTGELPSEVGNLKNLGALLVEKNNLSGKIPSTLGSCMSLEGLYMQDNLFEGSIPSSLRDLRGLRILNLTNNRLSGQIPEFLANLSLSDLGLAFNQFEGPLPATGVFANTSATSVIGNSKLCGGLPEFRLPKCSTGARIKNSNRKSLSRNVRSILIYTLSCFGGIVLLLILVYFLWFRKARKSNTIVLSSSKDEFIKVSYQNILKATNGFSTGSLMGVGSFGSVYKATFDGWEQNLVAVKVLNLTHYGASKSFIAECEALRNIRHRNLVKVLTACSGTDHQGNDFKALIYKFMINGNLDEWLHPKVTTNDEAPRKLDLLQRLSIAVDVACALDYLHHQCEAPIVHCDLKPSNVLLNEDMTAHIGDFGLVRFLPEATHKLITDQISSIGVKGSFGYIAPEYGAGGEVWTYGDVYSFGILILEMLTGKRPTDEMFMNGLNIHSFAKAAMPEHVLKIVDPAVTQDDRNTARHCLPKIQECLVSVMEIGVRCSSEFPRERMNMSDAAAALRVIRDKLADTRR